MRKSLLYMFFLLAPLFFTACKPSDPKTLISSHTWTFDAEAMKEEMLKNVTEEEKQMMESMWPMMVQTIKTYRISYNADGTYEVKAPMGKEEGTWELVGDNVLRQTASIEGEKALEPLDFTIEEINANKLVLAREAEQGKKIRMVLVPASSSETEQNAE